MRYLFQCIICGKEFEEYQKMNDEHKAFHCGIEAQRVFTTFHTPKDKQYYFDAPNKDGSMREIRSRGLYKKYLKDNGYADASAKECLSIKPNKDGRERAIKLAKKCANKIREKGAMSWVKGQENPGGRDKL